MKPHKTSTWTPWVVAALLPLAACDEVLQVDDPDVIPPDALTDVPGLQTQRNGALGEFTQWYGGGGIGTEGYVMMTGLFTDEYMHSGTFPTRQEIERRITPTDNGTLAAHYLGLHQARGLLESVAEQIKNVADNPKIPAGEIDPATDARIPEMLTLAGYMSVAFAEGFCSGVPFSSLAADGTLEFGEPQTTNQLFQGAVAKFDEALAHAGASGDIANLARVGRARALFSLATTPADYTAAVTGLAAIDSDWVFRLSHSANTQVQENQVFGHNKKSRRWSVGDVEGTNGLNYRTADDARIPVRQDGRGGFERGIDLFVNDNHLFDDDAQPIASGIEAQLYLAEAALQNGDNATWLNTLNALRQDWTTLVNVVRQQPPQAGEDIGTLPDLTDPGSQAARVDLHFREHAFWLYATGTRLGAMRRLVKPTGYGRDAETVFPTGTYFKGGTYGTDVNLPIHQFEENNPNFQQCLDRNP